MENSKANGDISFVSSGRSSTDRMLPPLYNSLETGTRMSFSSDQDLNYSFESMFQGRKSLDSSSPAEFTSLMFDNEMLSSSSSQAVVRNFILQVFITYVYG